MRRRDLCVGAGGWFGAVSAWAAELVIFGPDNFPPVVHLADGKPQGELVDLMRAVERQSGDRYRLQLVPWARALAQAKGGAGGLLGASKTAERLAWFDYSDPVFVNEVRLVARKDRAIRFTRLDDLRGKVLGGVNGGSYGRAVDEAAAAGLFRIDRDLNLASRLRKLLLGRIDAALVSSEMRELDAVIRGQPDLAQQREQLVVLPTPLVRDELFLVFPKSMNQREALARFNAALARVRAESGKGR